MHTAAAIRDAGVQGDCGGRSDHRRVYGGRVEAAGHQHSDAENGRQIAEQSQETVSLVWARLSGVSDIGVYCDLVFEFPDQLFGG